MIDTNALKDFDASEYLDSDEGIQIFLNDAFETNNPKYIANALGVAARAKGMTELAKKTGIRREQLYQALNENGNPTLQTLMPVISALGLSLHVSVTPSA